MSRPTKVRNSEGKVRWMVVQPGDEPKMFRSRERAVRFIERRDLKAAKKKWKVVQDDE